MSNLIKKRNVSGQIRLRGFIIFFISCLIIGYFFRIHFISNFQVSHILQNSSRIKATSQSSLLPTAQSIYYETREKNYEDLLKTITSLPKNVKIREKFFATNKTFQENFRALKQSNDLVNRALKNSILDQIFLGQMDTRKSDDFNFRIDTKNGEIVRKRRLPNLLGIGVKKCGTGALREFLAHHPKFIKPIGWFNELTGFHNPEPHFYDDNFDKGLDWFFDLFPPSATSDVLFEKSPKYIASSNVPQRVYDTYKNFGNNEEKNVKIIAMFCDPSTRVLSDFLQSFMTVDWTVEQKRYVVDKYMKYERWGDMMNKEKTGMKPEVAEGFVKYIQAGIDFLQNMEANLSNNKDYSFSDFLAEMNDHKLDRPLNYTGKILNYQEIMDFKYVWLPISKGIYSYQLQNWLKYFNKDQFIIIDGKEFQRSPGKFIENIQKRFNLPVSLKEENFVYVEKKGNFCYRESVDSEPECLKGQKGRTKSSDGKSKMPDEAVEILDRFYEKYNRQFYEIIGEDYRW